MPNFDAIFEIFPPSLILYKDKMNEALIAFAEA